MPSRLSKLALVAALASSLPAVAAAHGCDEELGRDAYRRPVEALPAPPAAYPGATFAPETPPRWRRAHWRARELARIRAALLELDARHAELRARFAWNPRRAIRLERRYAARRAALERRWVELQVVAWR